MPQMMPMNWMMIMIMTTMMLLMFITNNYFNKNMKISMKMINKTKKWNWMW